MNRFYSRCVCVGGIGCWQPCVCVTHEQVSAAVVRMYNMCKEASTKRINNSYTAKILE